jgi:hypothetical protein
MWTFQKYKEKKHIPHQRMFLTLSLLMNARIESVHFWDSILTQKWEKQMTAWSLVVQVKHDWKAAICIRVYRGSKLLHMIVHFYSINLYENQKWSYNFLCKSILPNFIKIHLAFLILKCGNTVSSARIQLCTSCKEHTISDDYTCVSVTEILYF